MKKCLIIFSVMVALVSISESFSKTNPITAPELGKLLFFDPILSKDSTISCASCHKPEFAFADTSAVSIGHAGKKGKRNTPSSMNLLLHRTFFWDGRAEGLEAQAWEPIRNPDEMNLSVEEAVFRVRNNKRYQVLFQTVYNKAPDSSMIALALAAFERTLETSKSPVDIWKLTQDPDVVSEEAKRGFVLFNTKANCVKCHFGPDLTANEFRNIGLFNGRELNDSGRMAITGKAEDLGRFKTPSLRNVAITAPYMHNGMFRTLKEVIVFYNDPEKSIPGARNRDTLIKPLFLTANEQADLEAFLIALVDNRFKKIK